MVVVTKAIRLRVCRKFSMPQMARKIEENKSNVFLYFSLAQRAGGYSNLLLSGKSGYVPKEG